VASRGPGRSDRAKTIGAITNPSKNRVDRAGARLRGHQTGDQRLDWPVLTAELAVVEAFRAAHAGPLTRVAANLRYYIREASDGSFIVGQRLKRMVTILDKLERHPHMSLARMNDIGGCRAVLANQEDVDHVIERLRAQRRWELLPRVWDYVEHPKPDGYRAKHLVAIKDGMRIEVQLRTAPQHAWAELVERLDRRLGTRAKFGAADPQLAAALNAAAAVMVAFERGEVSLAATMRELQRVARATRGMT
jgi:putative GTP pyrophosphokinase